MCVYIYIYIHIHVFVILLEARFATPYRRNPRGPNKFTTSEVCGDRDDGAGDDDTRSDSDTLPPPPPPLRRPPPHGRDTDVGENTLLSLEALALQRSSINFFPAHDLVFSS